MESELWNRLKLLWETWNVPCWSLTFVTDISAPCVCYWWWRWLPFFLSLTEIPLQQLVYKGFAFSKQYFWWVFEGQPSSCCRGSKFLFRHQGLGDERHSPEREDQERSGKTNSTQWKQGKKMPRGRANKHKYVLKALKGVCALVLGLPRGNSTMSRALAPERSRQNIYSDSNERLEMNWRSSKST